jgi:quercetin dioxygenase-like cupin family protein
MLLDLEAESASLLEEAKPAPQGRAARTLIKEGPLRLTLLAMREGSVINEHRAGGPVSIKVINDGAATIEAAGSSHALKRNSTLVLDADVPHSVQATRDTVLLLTIAMPR